MCGFQLKYSKLELKNRLKLSLINRDLIIVYKNSIPAGYAEIKVKNNKIPGLSFRGKSRLYPGEDGRAAEFILAGLVKPAQKIRPNKIEKNY